MAVYTGFVYIGDMRNITLSADETLIEKARRKARSENRSLNVVFREWLKQYVAEGTVARYEQLMTQLDDVASGGTFSRDELNER